MSVTWDEARGKWRASWYSPGGKRERHWYATKGDATQAHALARLRNPKGRNKPRADSLTLTTYATEYIDRHADRLSGSTVRNYRRAVASVADSIGKMGIGTIDPPAFRRALDELHERRGLGWSTVTTTRNALRSIIRHALADGLIFSDPTIAPPRRGRASRDHGAGPACLTEEQARAVLTAAREAGGDTVHRHRHLATRWPAPRRVARPQGVRH